MHTLIGNQTHEAAQLLLAGKVVAIPTETVYGLAANALDAEAVATIFEVKQRPFFDPLIVHVASLDAVYGLVTTFPEKAKALAAAYWPGPLTLVLPRKKSVPDLTTSGLETVGIRMPRHSLTLELLRQLPFPLAAPSANPFGYISPTTAQHVMDQLGGKIPYILDGGACEVGVESTIVEVKSDGEATVLRKGGLSIEDIERVIGCVKVQQTSSSAPQAPGMLASHYAPRKPFYLGDVQALLAAHAHRRVAVMRFCEAEHATAVLSAKGDLHEAARELFATMRRLDALDVELIIAELVPEEGLGRAINDRLRRAAARS